MFNFLCGEIKPGIDLWHTSPAGGAAFPTLSSVWHPAPSMIHPSTAPTAPAGVTAPSLLPKFWQPYRAGTSWKAPAPSVFNPTGFPKGGSGPIVPTPTPRLPVPTTPAQNPFKPLLSPWNYGSPASRIGKYQPGAFTALPPSLKTKVDAVMKAIANKNIPAPPPAAPPAAGGGTFDPGFSDPAAPATPALTESGMFSNPIFKSPTFWIGSAALVGMLAFLADTNGGPKKRAHGRRPGRK